MGIVGHEDQTPFGFVAQIMKEFSFSAFFEIKVKAPFDKCYVATQVFLNRAIKQTLNLPIPIYPQ